MTYSVNIISTLVFLVYFYNQFVSKLNASLSSAEFVGLSLIYTAIPLVAIALILVFIKSEVRAKNWSHVAGVIKSIETKKTLLGNSYKLEYSYYINDIGYINEIYSNRRVWSSLGQLMMNSAFRNGRPDSWKNKRIKVYFNKDNYWDSMLEHNSKIDLNIMALPALTMLAILSYTTFIVFL